jgi:hypothetical protein
MINDGKGDMSKSKWKVLRKRGTMFVPVRKKKGK